MSKVCIVGMGYVGSAMAKIFPDAIGYDPPRGLMDESGARAQCELAIICVPTPPLPDGSCDISLVRQAVADLPASIPYVLIKSTVPPGTTDELNFRASRAIAFSPEYVGEGGYHVPPQFPDPHDPRGHGFMIIGGESLACSRIIDLFMTKLGPSCNFMVMAAIEAELVKYLENAYLALKVVFANEMRPLAERLGANYHVVREGWLADPRVGRSHSAAFAASPGFDGKCLPKDTAALLAVARKVSVSMPLLQAVVDANALQRGS